MGLGRITELAERPPGLEHGCSKPQSPHVLLMQLVQSNFIGWTILLSRVETYNYSLVTLQVKPPATRSASCI